MSISAIKIKLNISKIQNVFLCGPSQGHWRKGFVEIAQQALKKKHFEKEIFEKSRSVPKLAQMTLTCSKLTRHRGPTGSNYNQCFRCTWSLSFLSVHHTKQWWFSNFRHKILQTILKNPQLQFMWSLKAPRNSFIVKKPYNYRPSIVLEFSLPYMPHVSDNEKQN